MPRRILEGKVVSAKQDKTVTVLVESKYMHPIYKKYLKKSKKFAAHDEANTAKEGEVIRIVECAPISKNKRFTVYDGSQMTENGGQKTEAKAEKAAPKKETKKPAAKKAAPKAKKEDKEETKD